jgi:hypothetical protein
MSSQESELAEVKVWVTADGKLHAHPPIWKRSRAFKDLAEMSAALRVEKFPERYAIIMKEAPK